MPPRRAIITGASSALGLEFARQLGAHCDELILCGRRRERLEQASATLASASCTIDIITADLGSTIGIARLVETIRQRGPFRYLINNADSGAIGSFSKQAPAANDAMISVNIQAPMQLSLAALAGMQQAGSGYIVNVSSRLALDPASEAAVYGGSKAFLVNFSEALQQEVSGQSIRIQCLCPRDTRIASGHHQAAPCNAPESAPPTRQLAAEDIVNRSLEALHGSQEQVVCVPEIMQQRAPAP